MIFGDKKNYQFDMQELDTNLLCLWKPKKPGITFTIYCYSSLNILVLIEITG